MPYKIFISYSTKDITIVDHVKKTLSNDKIDVYVAEYSAMPGANLSQDIQNAILYCDLFIVIWSKNSKSSEWVSQEIGIAKGNNKYILPVVLNKSLELPAFIKGLKYIDSSINVETMTKKIKSVIFPKVKIKQNHQRMFLMAIGTAIFYMFAKNDDAQDNSSVF